MRIPRFLAFMTISLSLLLTSNVQATTPNTQNQPSMSATFQIEDGNLFGFPEGFDVQVFLNNQPGLLKSFYDTNEGNLVSVADAITFYSQLSGIDPRILLSLIEVKTGLITDPNAGDQQVNACFGNRDPEQSGFLTQLRWGLDTLLDFYDQASQEGFLGKLILADNQEFQLEPTINPASFAINAFLAYKTDHNTWVGLIGDGPNSFKQIYENFFGPLGTNTPGASLTALTELRLPWGNGETWYYTGGPHTGSAGGVRYSKAAIDFAPGGGSGCFNSGSWVRAAKAGTVVYANCNFVRIDHGGGWSTGYFHLSSIQVHVGQQVQVGTKLGHPSCGVGASCGWSGRATGSHVHFDTRINNKPQRIAGTSLDGWVVGAAASDYYGTLTLGSTVKNASWTRKDSTNGITSVAQDSDTDDARTISSGETLYGNRDPGTDVDLYYINLSAQQSLVINMEKITDGFDPYLTLKDPNGQVVAVDDDSGSGRNARISITVGSSGRYQILASGWSTTTGQYSLKATVEIQSDNEDGRWLPYDQSVSGKINNNTDTDTYYFNGVAGRIITISMWKFNSNLDSYLLLYNPAGSEVAFNDDGGGNRNAMISITLSNTGVYRVVARSWNSLSNGEYQMRLTSLEPENYALNQPVHVSSTFSGSYPGSNAVDGQTDTRWSSEYDEIEWIYVDLGSSVNINNVTLRWGSAYATAYGVYVWNGSIWQNVYFTAQGNGGTDILNFSTRNTRYVMVYGYVRGTSWGYSLYEFGVYDSTLAVMPIVPPEDPTKDPDTVEEQTPPPATSFDKQDGVLALSMGFDGEQEFLPLPSTFDGENPTIDNNKAGLPVAHIEAIHFDDTLNPGQIILYSFNGSANDNDVDGEGEQIVAYEWSSNLDGVLSTSADFARLSIDLSAGTHTISLKAKDNEGIWSESVTMELIVEHPLSVSRIYLPLLNR